MLITIKPDYSPLGLLGKLFFRREPPWMQRRKMMMIMWSLLVGLICGGFVIALVIVQNTRK